MSLESRDLKAHSGSQRTGTGKAHIFVFLLSEINFLLNIFCAFITQFLRYSYPSYVSHFYYSLFLWSLRIEAFMLSFYYMLFLTACSEQVSNYLGLVTINVYHWSSTEHSQAPKPPYQLNIHLEVSLRASQQSPGLLFKAK